MRKRILALLMAAILFVGILPATSFADETDAVPEVTVIAEAAAETVSDSTEATEPTESTEATEATEATEETMEPMEETLPVVEEVPDLTLSDLESTEHEINSAADLVTLYNEVAAGDSKAGHSYTFTTDITLPEDWNPIGVLRPGTTAAGDTNAENILPFSGVIDGDGHTLTVPEGGLPLLGYVKGATVKNLNIYGTKIAGAGLVNNYAGRGFSGSAIIIDNVTLKSGSKTLKSGLVAASDPNQYACASAGFTVTIQNSVIEEGVIVGYDAKQVQIGSFAARISGTIEDCESYAVVYGKDYVGGILGTKDNAMGQCEVKNCKFHGTVDATGNYAGGIVGGGYDNSTAPNGGCPIILNCSVDGTVYGNARVGGIFGGDGFVAQTWDNVVGSISFNKFTGKVIGYEYVGAIIGYRNSLNKYDTIKDNSFSDDCGVDKGIGFIQYLDTNYVNPATMEGTIVINTGADVSQCPYVEGCAWKADHNRTDDPLGVDADKLCKKVSASAAPICYQLEVSGTYKTEYTAGEELDLTGIKLTAYWSDGSTTDVRLRDVRIEGYDKDKEGKQTIKLTYDSAEAYITVTVKPASAAITVSVSILGDSNHNEPTNNGGPHGLAFGGLETWVSVSHIPADAAETVWDVLQRVGQSNGISYSADSNNSYGTLYIRSVNDLSEFDNGPNSGWMYTVNGTHPNVGVGEKYLKQGDEIVLHYTDDYSYEEGGTNAVEMAENLDEVVGGETLTMKVLNSNTGKALKSDEVRWSVKNPDDKAYATISASGSLKTYPVDQRRNVTLVCELLGSRYGRIEHTVTIYPAAMQLEIWNGAENVTGKTLCLNAAEGSRLDLTGKLYPTDAKEGISWKTSNARIATVTDGVVAYAGKTGTATITATAQDGSGQKAAVKIQVGILTTGVEIVEPASITLRSGKSVTLIAVTTPEKPTVSGVTFSLVNAADSAYATVSSSGKVTAKTVNEPHAVQIKATSKDAAQVSDTITLTILPKSEQMLILKSGEIYVTGTTLVGNVGDTIALSAFSLNTEAEPKEEAQTVTWKSSNTKAATVADDGVVTCVKTGTAKITATANDGSSAVMTIKVTNLVKEIKIETKSAKDDFVIASGKSVALKATVSPDNASDKKVTWSIAGGADYATITSSGVLKANKGLTSPVEVIVKATAKDGSGVSNEQTVTVKPLAQGVRILRDADGNKEPTNTTLVWDMAQDAQLSLYAWVYPGTADDSVTWKSSSTKIASIDANGTVTCHKAGTVTITATANDGSGKKASFKLTVVKQMKELKLEGGVIAGGKSLTLKPVISPADTTNKKLTWSVSENTVGAKISSSGKLTTKAVIEPATVTITAAAQDGSGLTAYCDVTIYPATTKVTIGGAPGELAVGTSLTLFAASTPENAANVYIWKSSNQYVTVEDGTVVASEEAMGKTVTITCVAADGTNKSASVKIKIVAATEG